MKIGNPETRPFSQNVHVNGYIQPSVNGMARISSLIGGRVSRIDHTVGDRVYRGDPLFSLEGPEIVALQQEYAEVHQQLLLLKADLQRYKVLSRDSVVAEKEFLRIRSEYNTMASRSEGLKARLRLVRLDPGEVEKGNIRSELIVHTPIGGIVSDMDLVLGQMIDPSKSVMEIVDPASLQLNLRVFEQDMAGLSKGQEVVFSVPGRPDRQYKGELSHLGNSIDPRTKTVKCIARLNESEHGTLVNNLYVEATIITGRRQANVVPEQAVVRKPGGDFVWVRTGESEDQITFRLIPVKTGMSREGFTEVADSGLMNILLVGAYDLPSDD